MEYPKKLKNQCSVESTMPITTKNYHFQKLKTTREPTSWGQGPLTRGMRICRLSFIVPSEDDDELLEGGERGSLEPSSGGHRAGVGPCFEHLPWFVAFVPESLDVPVEFDYPPISSVPTPGVSNIWDLMDSGLNYLCINSHLPFLTNCVFRFIQSSLESLRGI
jgi:hypothetical protein